MTAILPSALRRSRHLLDWSPAACLAALDQSLTARTGQVATFSRASIKTALDTVGVVRVVPSGLPAFHWALDPVTGLVLPGLTVEGARTNALLWSRDLTNGAWAKTSCTVALDQTGADNQLNTASSLLATAGNATVLQAVALASSTRVFTAYVKRLIGTGTVSMTLDNGATWTAVAVTAGWTRVSIPAQTLANPIAGFRLTTSGDKIAVDFTQHEAGSTASSVLPTTTVAVARAADSLSLPTLAVAGTVYQQYWDLVTQTMVETVTPYTAGGALSFAADRAYTATRVATGTRTLAFMQTT